MAEQRRSGTQRKSSASKSGKSGSTSKSKTTKAASSGGGSQSKRGSGGGGSSSRSNGTSGREAVLQAREQVSELMGRPVESVLGMDRDDDGWVITVQVVELARIPNSTDVLGDYAVTVDSGGEVIGYRRMRRYHRAQADDG
jgi:hypothetical protein